MPTQLTFEQWKNQVDEWLISSTGMTSEDLPDIDYFGLYEAGDSPKQAAKEAIRNAREN